MKQLRFGDLVKFSKHVVHRTYSGERHRHVVPLREVLVGQVAGRTYRYTGKVVYEGQEEGSHFEAEDRVGVWLVKTSLCGKAYEVLDEDVVVVDDEEFVGKVRAADFTIPEHVAYAEWSQTYKDELRKVMASVPRDGKGRWQKTRVEVRRNW